MTDYDRLVLHKLVLLMVPTGCPDPLKAASEAILTNAVSDMVKDARAWVVDAILTVRQAKAPNPFRNKTDEEIARVIMKQVDERAARSTGIRREVELPAQPGNPFPQNKVATTSMPGVAILKQRLDLK